VVEAHEEESHEPHVVVEGKPANRSLLGFLLVVALKYPIHHLKAVQEIGVRNDDGLGLGSGAGRKLEKCRGFRIERDRSPRGGCQKIRRVEDALQRLHLLNSEAENLLDAALSDEEPRSDLGHHASGAVEVFGKLAELEGRIEWCGDASGQLDPQERIEEVDRCGEDKRDTVPGLEARCLKCAGGLLCPPEHFVVSVKNRIARPRHEACTESRTTFECEEDFSDGLPARH
jgi:hypothetical protein